MIKGIISSQASMRPKTTRMEMLANNLANINTTGFKKDRIFVEMLKDTVATQGKESGELDGLKTTTYIDFSEGSLNQTGNPLDLAIQGRGFFVVDTPRGQRYTRNGHLTLSNDGTLITPEGYPVMGAAGKIQIPNIQKTQQTAISVSPTGEVTIGHDIAGRIRIVDFENLAAIKKDHESLFEAEPGQRVIEGPGSQTTVRQGSLEESNVEGIEEMITMIELSRGFETDQKMIQAQDASIEKTIEVGRV